MNIEILGGLHNDILKVGPYPLNEWTPKKPVTHTRNAVRKVWLKEK